MEVQSKFEWFVSHLDTLWQYHLFVLKNTPITVGSVAMFVIMLLAFYLTSRLIVRFTLKRILKRFGIERGIQFNLLRVSHYLLMTAGTLVAFQFIGVDLAGLAVVFGLLSVGIGFGLRNITSNFVSGLILLFERPISVGDRVSVGDVEGDVTSINMRSTSVRTLDNIVIIVPNSQFVESTVTNWSHGDPKIRLNVEVGVSYGSDLDRVIDALKTVAEEHPEVLDRPEPSVLLESFGDSSWNMKLRVWLTTSKMYYVTRSELNQAIVRKFREMEVEIPFPQRDLHIRSPLPLPVGQAG